MGEKRGAVLRKMCCGETLHLRPDKSLFWEEESTLIIADLHFGKTEHFRKNGIAVPGRVLKRELKRLDSIIDVCGAREVLFLGDLFHSVYNRSWDIAADYFKNRTDVVFTLIVGNHDILGGDDYANAGIEVEGILSQRGPFIFIHEKVDDLPEGLFSISGHIHPGVQLTGNGRQKMTLPCFVFGGDHCIVPAFGAFTGLAKIQPTSEHEIYAVAEDKVLDIGHLAESPK